MKRILSNNIVENVRRQPFNKASLEHLQEAFQEVLYSMLQALNVENMTDVIVLHGCVDRDAGATSYDISAGAIFYQGEVYQVAPLVGSSPPNVPVLSIVTTYRAGDPVKFSDNNDFNVHEIKTMQWTLAPFGSGIINFAQVKRFAITYQHIDHTVARHYYTPGSHIDDLDDALTGGIAHVTGADVNAPAGTTTADTFLLIITDSGATNGETVQTAIQLKGASGAGAGAIYTRRHDFLTDTWTAWTTINNPNF